MTLRLIKRVERNERKIKQLEILVRELCDRVPARG